MARILNSKMDIYNEGFQLESDRLLLTRELKANPKDEKLKMKLLKIENKLKIINTRFNLRDI